MKNIIIIFLTCLFSLAIYGQDVTGEWNGVLKVQGTQLRVVFNVTSADNGLIATMDSPDQEAIGIPTTTTSFEDSILRITIANAKIEYEGTLGQDNVIVGTFKQSGQEFPLNLSRERHVIQYSKTDSVKQYTTVMSWDHWRELYIAKGNSEAEADSAMREKLTWFAAMDRTAGDDLIGVAAPPFRFDGWLNSDPLTLDDLKGNVVLVRWFTDTCPFCASSAPALRELHEEYSDKGLKIIGVYHPKAGRNDPLDVQRVQRTVDAREFKFPIGIDWDWRNKTLKDWWLTGPDRPGTFILDKSGVIQFIHPGMEYHEDNGSELHTMCVSDMGRVRAAIERLIAE